MNRSQPASLCVLAIALLFAALGSRTGFSGFATAHDDVLAKYWSCESGFTFERSGMSLVRCRKPGFVDTRPLAPCPPATTVNGVSVGLSAADDFHGPTDMCVGFPAKPAGPASTPPPATVVARACAPADLASGWSKVIRIGLDRCEKTIAESIDYPRKPVQR